MQTKILTLIILISLISCKKNQIGGKSDVVGVVKHHSTPMPGARVFVKYGTEDFPGKDTSIYDYVVKTNEKGEFKISFYKGKYYLYGVVFDYSLNPPAWASGGLPLKLRTNEDIKITLAVTEQH